MSTIGVILISALTLSFGVSSVSAQALSKRVLVVGMPPQVFKEVAAAVPEVTLIAATASTARDKLSEVDALVAACNPRLLKDAMHLKWIQHMGAGVENCMLPELAKTDVVLTNMKIIQGPQIADHALALLLALSRNLDLAMEDKRSRTWRARQYQPIELRNKTALVIGLGGIGTQIAIRAWAFGMRVLAVDPKDIPVIPFVEAVVTPAHLHDVLTRADVVFMAAPFTAETKRMLGKKEFGLMKRGAYFINVSRGGTVDTEALMGALRNGTLAGAGLDVTEPEPLPADHPLWEIPNVVITPHIATVSDHGRERFNEVVIENLRRFAKGKPLRNVVDKRLGY